MDILPFFQQIAQHLRDSAFRRVGVGVRRFAVAAQDRALFHIVLAQVAVRVSGDGNRQIRPGQLPDFFQQPVFAGPHSFHLTGTVQKQIDSVQFVKMRF